MKIKLSDLRKIVREVVAESNSTRLTESHSRITSEEINAWKNGDWGFVSEGPDATNVDLDPQSIYDAYASIKSANPIQLVTLSALAIELGVTPDALHNAMNGTTLRILREPVVVENL